MLQNREAHRVFGGALLVFLIALTLFIVLSLRLPDVLYTYNNGWFGADTQRVFENLTDRESDHYRSRVHPLFALLCYSPTIIFRSVGFSSQMSLRLLLAFNMLVWSGALYFLFWRIGQRVLDAVVFTVFCLTSSASMFWLPIVESFPFGSTSILLAFIPLFFSSEHRLTHLGHMIGGVLTFGLTITNWMATTCASFFHLSLRRFFWVSLATFGLATVLWGVQKMLFPSAQLFGASVGLELRYLNQNSMLHTLRAFLWESVVFGELQFRAIEGQIRVDVADNYGLSSSPLVLMVHLIWTGLLLQGMWAWATVKDYKIFRWSFGATLLGQLALHLVYGSETFLYAAHFLPLLALLAFWGTFLMRKSVLMAVVVITLVNLYTNLSYFGAVASAIGGNSASP